MLEFLVRREREVDMKTEVAVKKLQRPEEEREEEEDKEREASRKEALADKTKVVKLVVDKWFVDKGFGFGKVPSGEIVFIHASVVHGGEVLMNGTDAWVQVVNDEARAEGGYRARNACGRNAWKEDKDMEKANRVAQQVRRAAALTAELPAQSEEKVAEVCDHPLGLRDERAEHIAAPNMGRWLTPSGRNDATLAVRQNPSSNRQRLLQSRGRIPWRKTAVNHASPRSNIPG